MKQAKIQQRLIETTSETVEKTTKRICDITAVVCDEQSKMWQTIDKSNRDQIQLNYYLKNIITDEIKQVNECQQRMENITANMTKYRTITSFSSMTYTINDLFDFIKANSKK